ELAMDSIKSARTPFDDADADVILRSCDGVDFRLYKNVLAKASTFFREFFSLPKPPDAPTTLRAFILPENADTLERLFRSCYPVARPHFPTIDDVRTTLAAATKYAMDHINPILEEALLRFLEREPLRVYAIAYLFRLEDVARAAARALLEYPTVAEPDTPPPEFDELPTRAMYALLIYRRRCVAAVLATLEYKTHGWMNMDRRAMAALEPGVILWTWLKCERHQGWPRQLEPLEGPEGGSIAMPQQWWQDHCGELKRKLAQRPVARLATDMSLIELTVSDASACATCRPHALRDVLDFGETLAEKIVEALDEVR
ncbi:uncharacterized protein TRAVEDRAFT_82705, partial [Trametes versicolor FP-101664 SS1]|uniref:uncharacterized protein n=1 Tax=Trametes versicolor (strain FP-101664) TaxID=717944 RepID=UPI0004623F5D